MAICRSALPSFPSSSVLEHFFAAKSRRVSDSSLSITHAFVLHATSVDAVVRQKPSVDARDGFHGK